jgi:hypothetical protein
MVPGTPDRVMSQPRHNFDSLKSEQRIMIEQVSNLNWWAVLVAFFPYTVLGALWFTLFFIKPYKAALGKADQDLNNKAPIYMVGPMICTIVVTLATAVLIQALQIQTIAGAIELSAVIGMGYLVSNTFNIAINPNIPNPIQYGMITGTFHLVGITMTSIILVVMK